MEITLIDHVKNEKVLPKFNEKRNILHSLKRKKAISMVTPRVETSILKHVIEGNLEERAEVTGDGERRRKQPLDDLKETAEHRKLKQETLDGTLW